VAKKTAKSGSRKKKKTSAAPSGSGRGGSNKAAKKATRKVAAGGGKKKTVKKKAAKKKAATSAARKKAAKKKVAKKKTAKKVVKQKAAKAPGKKAAKKKAAKSTGKKSTTKKTAARKSATKKSTTKKSSAKSSPSERPASSKVVKPTPSSKPAVEETPAVERVHLSRAEVPIGLDPSTVLGQPPTIKQLKKVKTGLSRKQLNQLKAQLLEKKAELLGDVRSMQAAREAANSGDLSHMPLHMADVGGDMYDQEFTLGLMESDRRLLAEIDEALARMRDGYFGVCLESAVPIEPIRLEIKPWAKYCIEVARQREKRGLVN